MYARVAIVLTTVLAITSAFEKIVPTPMKDLDPKKFLGVWYGDQYVIEAIAESGLNAKEAVCSCANLTCDGETLTTDVSVKYGDATSQIYVSRFSKGVTGAFEEAGGIKKFTVICTDYDNYLVSDLCFGPLGYLLSISRRSKTTALPKETIDKIIKELKEQKYDTTKLKVLDPTKC